MTPRVLHSPYKRKVLQTECNICKFYKWNVATATVLNDPMPGTASCCRVECTASEDQDEQKSFHEKAMKKIVMGDSSTPR